MSEEEAKVVKSTEESAAPAEYKDPTAKDAGLLFAMMFPLFLAIVLGCYNFSQILSIKDGLDLLGGTFFGAVLALLTVLLTLPTVIIGSKHKKERWFYNLFRIVGFVVMGLAGVSILLIALKWSSAFAGARR
jgi:hypothetical protein